MCILGYKVANPRQIEVRHMLDIQDSNPIPSRINLRKEFPLAIRSIFLRSFIWMVPFFVIVLVVPYFYDTLRPVFPENSLAVQGIDLVLMVLIGIALVLMLGKFIHEVFYYIFYDYQVEMEHLVITKGLFNRSRASVPISKINDCSLQRGILELFFGLYHVRVMTSSPLADLTSVEGVSSRNAVGLQNRILSLVETTLPEMKEAEAEDKVPPPIVPDTEPAATIATAQSKAEAVTLYYDIDDTDEESQKRENAA